MLAQPVYPLGVVPPVAGMGIVKVFPGYGSYFLKHMHKMKFMPKIIRGKKKSIFWAG